MTKTNLFLLLSFFIIISCNENIEPFGEFREKYVMNSIIRADTSYQVVLLSKSYITNNFNPLSDSTNHSIAGALVRLWNGNDVVTILKDTIINRPENDIYKTPLYYTNNFQPLPNSSIEIEAILPDGKKLKSSAMVPDRILFNKELCDTIIPPPSKNYL